MDREPKPSGMTRRRALGAIAGALCMPRSLASETRVRERPRPFAPVVPGYSVTFPRDEGSHPDFRIEWWYVTGWLEGRDAPALGFQVTFFRVRPELRHANPSAFAPRHILIAHAALSDPALGRLLQAQRAARASFGLAGAAEGRVEVWVDDWRLEQHERLYRARIPARELSLDLVLDPVQPPLLHGEGGFSRKGPSPEAASYYYSLPHLAAKGQVGHGGRIRAVSGSAWMDHEWSSHYLEPQASGWDWCGIQLDDGAALMAFRMRARDGGVRWAGGTLRARDGRATAFAPHEVRFVPLREWRSPRSGALYPVSFLVRAGAHELVLEPLFDDQEHDARATAGAIYWEGAVRALRAGRAVGRGYLELTGYWRRLEL
jgi:predicted secreted hydrolase